MATVRDGGVKVKRTSRCKACLGNGWTYVARGWQGGQSRTYCEACGWSGVRDVV